MMEGYIINLGIAPKTYTGYRMATSDMEVSEGEKFIKSLNGYSQEVLELPQTPQNKLRELVALMKTLDLPTQASFLPVSSGVETALNAGNVPLAVFVVNGIDTQGSAEVEALKQAVLAILEN
jgi:hypothetical protein